MELNTERLQNPSYKPADCFFAKIKAYDVFMQIKLIRVLRVNSIISIHMEYVAVAMAEKLRSCLIYQKASQTLRFLVAIILEITMPGSFYLCNISDEKSMKFLQ